MGILITRDPSELTRMSINTWHDRLPSKTIEALVEAIAELVPHEPEIAISEEHVFHEESLLELSTEILQHIKDCVDDHILPTLVQLNIVKHGSSHYEGFLLSQCNLVPEEMEVSLHFESVMWWDEPRPEIEAEFRLWHLEE